MVLYIKAFLNKPKLLVFLFSLCHVNSFAYCWAYAVNENSLIIFTFIFMLCCGVSQAGVCEGTAGAVDEKLIINDIINM